jgi:hypothetical protein
VIKLSELKESDVGRWVMYDSGHGETERGRIKSWNEKFVFVVYSCDNQWERFQDFTGCATHPEDLRWLIEYKCTDCGTTFKTGDRHIEYDLDCYCGGSICKIKEGQ